VLHLAAELIAGLDDVDEKLSPAEWKRAWQVEIERRLAGRRPGIPWEKVRERSASAEAEVAPKVSFR
jgi:hypothetical protein